MEREKQIIEAKEVLRKLLSRPGRPHPRNIRMHRQAMEDNVHRLRALEGLCGQCVNLKLSFRHVDGKDIVAVYCRKEYHPLDLYANTPLGESADCDGFPREAKV